MVGQYQSLSIVAGPWKQVEYRGNKVGGCSAACNGCVALMTTNPDEYLALSFPGVDYDHLDLAVDMAITRGNAESVIITGKREPTKHPQQVSDILEHLQRNGVNVVKEIQTNALDIMQPAYVDRNGWLDEWYDHGLRVVSLSVVDVEDRANTEYFCRGDNKYPNLENTVTTLQNKGFTVRLSLIMTHPYVDTPDDVERVVDYCREFDQVQLSIRPMRRTRDPPNFPAGKKVWDWVGKNTLSEAELQKIADHITANTKAPDDISEYLAHDGVLYDYKGPKRNKRAQNLAFIDCITHQPEKEMADGVRRQLIYYTNGRISRDWTHRSNFIVDIGKEARAWIAHELAKKK